MYLSLVVELTSKERVSTNAYHMQRLRTLLGDMDERATKRTDGAGFDLLRDSLKQNVPP
jgi:hypothetical protein